MLCLRGRILVGSAAPFSPFSVSSFSASLMCDQHRVLHFLTFPSFLLLLFLPIFGHRAIDRIVGVKQVAFVSFPSLSIPLLPVGVRVLVVRVLVVRGEKKSGLGRQIDAWCGMILWDCHLFVKCPERVIRAPGYIRTSGGRR